MTAAARHDVAILGGGLAGLTLAIQLKQRDPGIDVVVVERNAHPVREAAFKVGESTVEIGAHYFAEVLGLRDHLDSEQLRKFGFRFFFSDGRDDVDRCDELGVSRVLPVATWQIDRGRFENFLGVQARELGVGFRDGTVVRTLDPGRDGNAHAIGIERDGDTATLHARWLVDASGRAGLLKRKLGLAEANDHDANAVWWRVDGCVDPNAWSEDAGWLARCTPAERWRSTNHMCGPGYWVWLIPLASGAHSVGIVCDPRLHPLQEMNTHARAMDWLRRHQPRVAATLDAPAHAVQDFAFLRGFSHGCSQVFSADRWAITGEAGVFLDPFYSPGSDFIAIANTYICDLVGRDRAGQAFAPYAAFYEQLYFSFYRHMLTLYQDQYPLFGDAQVLPVKVVWDYTWYWGLLAPLFFHDRITDLALLGRLRPEFQRSGELNRAMQRLLRAWAAANRDAPAADGPAPERPMLDQYGIDWFHEMNRALTDRLDGEALLAQLRSNATRMDWLAAEILGRARALHPGLDDGGLAALLDGRAPAPPSLAPHWYAAAA